MSSSLSLGNLCRRCQTVSPPLHFTSHELVNIIQRHLFHSTFFPLPSFFFYFSYFKYFFFVGFVVRYWMMMTWCFGATSLLTWPLSVKHQTCAKLSDVHSTYRLSSLFSNHIMASSMIISFFLWTKKYSSQLPYLDVTTIASYPLNLYLKLQARGTNEP